MSPGGVDQYHGVDVRFVHGHNPDLVVLDEAAEKQMKRFDLTRYATEEALHELMVTEGFVKKTGQENEMQNKHESCYSWRNLGECLRNPTFMRANCGLACHNLMDTRSDCQPWAQAGECEKNSKFMYTECPVACGWKKEL